MTTFLGKPVTLAGQAVAVGSTAPDFTLTTTDLTKKSLSDFADKVKVISIIPSIDTGICSTQTRTFNQTLSDLDDTVVITVSKDLPFAQARWCGAQGLENAVMLSDYVDSSFGKAYGVLMEECQEMRTTSTQLSSSEGPSPLEITRLDPGKQPPLN